MKKFKHTLIKLISLIGCLIMAFSVAACAPNSPQGDGGDEREQEVSTPADNKAPTESVDKIPEKDSTDEEVKQPAITDEDSTDDDSRLPSVKYNGSVSFKDVGEKFKTVSKPLYDAAQTILDDLVENGDVVLEEARNPRITSIRFFYGRSFEIRVLNDLLTTSGGEKAEFLQQEVGYSLENFGEGYDEVYEAYTDFLHKERQSQCFYAYEEMVLPYARQSAEMILKKYEEYKSSEYKEVERHNYGKQIILSKDSSLSGTYDKIIKNLNDVLYKRHYPRITNQDLQIAFGGNTQLAKYARWIIIETHISCLNYTFYISFNQDGEIPQEFLNHFEGTLIWGYEYENPDLFNPENEEYAELFARVKIEEMDLSNISTMYGYDGVGSALYCSADGEDTFLYFE